MPFASSGSATVALTNASVAVALPGSGTDLTILNTTGAHVAVAVGCTSGLIANAASPIIVPAGQRATVAIGTVATWVAAFPLTSTTGQVFFLRGSGETF